MTDATINNLLRRLHKTYAECGGTKYKSEEEDQLDKSLGAFDALKVLIVKKLTKTREVPYYIDVIYNIDNSSTR